MTIKITFLGTGGAIGVPLWNCNCKNCVSTDQKDKRFRSSILVEIDDKTILIDFGPDCRTQLLKYKIQKIDYAFLTHAHADHINGFMELACQKNLFLEAPAPILEELYPRIGLKWLKTRNPTITVQPFQKQSINGVEVDTVMLDHKKDYKKTIVPCAGYVFRSKNFSFAYMSDFNRIREPEKLKDLDLIIADGCGMELSTTGHLGVKGSVTLYNELQPKQMLLTHIKHKTGHQEIEDFLKDKGNIHPAYDGLQIIKD